MPNRWPIADGNWDDQNIWSGSIIPTASDDVFANNRTVNINTNIIVRSLQNSATGSAVSGGQFKLLNNVIVTASIFPATTTNTATTFNSFIEISQSNSAIIVGNITTRSGSGNYKYVIKTLDSSNLTISGNLTAGGASSFQVPLLHWSSGTVNISGSIVSGTANPDYGIWINSSGSLYINGNVNGGTGPNTHGIHNTGTNNFTNIIGNVTAGTNTTAHGINNLGASNFINIIGNITGGSGANANGINNTTFSTINITGSVISAAAGSGVGISLATTPAIVNISGSVRSAGNNNTAISSGTNHFLTIIGPISASISAPGVQSPGTTATNLFTGPFYNTGSFNAVYAYRMQVFNRPTRWTFDTEVAGVQKTLTTIESITGAPASSDVRQGVAYGLNGNLTGSLIIPDSSTVRSGVIVDTATGSAVFTAQDMFNVLTQNITTPGSIGELLTRASTVQTVGSTISTFKV